MEKFYLTTEELRKADTEFLEVMRSLERQYASENKVATLIGAATLIFSLALLLLTLTRF